MNDSRDANIPLTLTLSPGLSAVARRVAKAGGERGLRVVASPPEGEAGSPRTTRFWSCAQPARRVRGGQQRRFSLALFGLLTGLALSAFAAEQAKPQIEVCFVLDTTGSMGGLIEGAKQKIWSIANEMIGAKPTPDIRLALIGYRDRGDAYVTKLTDLTDDIDAVYAKLREFQAQGGGDGPESVNQALHEAVTRISWSQDRKVLKVIFLVGDAPPHMDYKDDAKYPDICQVAVRKDLIINTVQCGNVSETAPIWREIAKLSEGQYVALSQTGNMVALTTPVDGRIAELNRELGSTLIAYGSRREREGVVAKQAAAEAAASSVVADRLSYNRASGKTVQGKGELVDALAAGEVKLGDVKRDELPAELQKLDAKQLDAYVKEQQAKRAALQKELTELLQKREAHLAAEQKRLAAAGHGDAFDAKVTETVRAQAAKKGIRYE